MQRPRSLLEHWTYHKPHSAKIQIKAKLVSEHIMIKLEKGNANHLKKAMDRETQQS